MVIETIDEPAGGGRAQNERRRLLREPWKFGQSERAAALFFERRRYEST
jgi:hypothetical protein